MQLLFKYVKTDFQKWNKKEDQVGMNFTTFCFKPIVHNNRRLKHNNVYYLMGNKETAIIKVAGKNKFRLFTNDPNDCLTKEQLSYMWFDEEELIELMLKE